MVTISPAFVLRTHALRSTNLRNGRVTLSLNETYMHMINLRK